VSAPVSTYRVQVRPDFDLDATAALAGYLAALGVTHLYTAPLLAATPGSPHGYDVVDPTRTSPELGGEAGLDRLVAELRTHGLGLIVDIVPNHQGVARPETNPAWWSVLREGRSSRYAPWFDIDWERGPLLIPVLGDDDAVADLRVEGDELRYWEHRYPIAPGTAGGTPQQVHARQHYRLVGWRRADTELTYRRFFAVNDLAGVRVEDPDVRDATHAEILRWLRGGLVDGLRVDHPDGLRDPGGYLRWLRAELGDRWLVVEKILEPGEALPPSWPVDGTTGYDALRLVGGLFLDPEQAPEARVPLDEAVLSAKRETAGRMFATEATRLLRQIPEAADVPDASDALAEVAAWMPVYRSYLEDGTGADQVRAALAEAAPRYPDAVAALAPMLLNPGRDVAMRFQQYTGAVMAKGVEDTAFYRWNRFVALNEVGGAPDEFGVDPGTFHLDAAMRCAEHPRGMIALSTHDTKRGEDVRARLAVLAEVWPRWRAAFTTWTTHRPVADPDLADLVWQTAVGTWPIERDRLRDYLVKAAREAGVVTTWTDPDQRAEDALGATVDAMYDDPSLSEPLTAFAASITPAGWSNALGQKLVALTMPGVPDTYQGTELWDNSLVDPDNRRPVDFAERAAMLIDLDRGALPPIDDSGAAKLLVTARALRLRRDRPELFTGYAPCPVTGPHARHAVAFDRGGAVTVVTRLPVGLAEAGGWTAEDTLRLPAGDWRDEITGQDVAGPRVDLSALLRRYPVALLVRVSAAEEDA